ncbi:MAG: hypothetical protein FJ388_23370, partial [Verrucomicrobia bacterium]|nr:hypothetical protein [Verrucomicrobiota bacterium]
MPPWRSTAKSSLPARPTRQTRKQCCAPCANITCRTPSSSSPTAARAKPRWRNDWSSSRASSRSTASRPPTSARTTPAKRRRMTSRSSRSCLARATRSGSFGGEMTTRALLILICLFATPLWAGSPALPKIRVASGGRTFVTEAGVPFVPFGINYYRPGTGWAPQVWKQFDVEATRRDFARMRELGVNCVRVFISFGSFYMQPGALDEEGLKKFDQFLAMAEEAGIYVHPTGPDHWEGQPEWARTDQFADEAHLKALEGFWRLFAARYRGRNVIFAYDLKNEPSVGWDGSHMQVRWNRWLQRHHGSAARAAKAWGVDAATVKWGEVAVPPKADAPDGRLLLDYQRFREELADEWTRRQVAAIKSSDPRALVTVGMIQWSVPALLPGVAHYAAFRPARQARFLDFLEVHFYPLARGLYDYTKPE